MMAHLRLLVLVVLGGISLVASLVYGIGLARPRSTSRPSIGEANELRADIERLNDAVRCGDDREMEQSLEAIEDALAAGSPIPSVRFDDGCFADTHGWPALTSALAELVRARRALSSAGDSLVWNLDDDSGTRARALESFDQAVEDYRAVRRRYADALDESGTNVDERMVSYLQRSGRDADAHVVRVAIAVERAERVVREGERAGAIDTSELDQRVLQLRAELAALPQHAGGDAFGGCGRTLADALAAQKGVGATADFSALDDAGQAFAEAANAIAPRI